MRHKWLSVQRCKKEVCNMHAHAVRKGTGAYGHFCPSPLQDAPFCLSYSLRSSPTGYRTKIQNLVRTLYDGDKVWRKILKALQVMRDDDDCLDDVNDVKQVLEQVGVGQQLVERTKRCTVRSAYSVHKGRISGRHPNCRAWHELRKLQESFRSGQEEDCRECLQGAESC